MTKASSAERRRTQSLGSLIDYQSSGGGARSLWLWVAAGFLFIAILWAAMFIAARHADTRSVPLATQGGRP